MDLLGFRLVAEHVYELLKDFTGVEDRDSLLVNTVLHLFQIEQIVDKAEHQLRLVLNHHDQLLNLPVAL